MNAVEVSDEELATCIRAKLEEVNSLLEEANNCPHMVATLYDAGGNHFLLDMKKNF
jgi:hypothetical protein